ncbi:AEC family transporter [Halomonas sp. PA5]|nr:AEC family transporter [Halomonas sp. PA5]
MREIIVEIMLPIFILLGMGAFLHRLFRFHLPTLSILLTYLFLPVVVFNNLVRNEMEVSQLLEIGGFLILQFLVLAALTALFAKATKMDRELVPMFKNGIVLMNSGNFGLPVSQLVFAGNPVGVSVQITVLMFQNLLTYTYGVMTSASSQTTSLGKNLLELGKAPVLYALLLGLAFYLFDWELPTPLTVPLQQVSDAFIALALLVLGAQVAHPAIKELSPLFFLMVAGRLLVAPLIAIGVIFLVGLEGTVAQALLIASAFPMSRNSALFALQYNNRPEFAAQGVLVSTLLSCVTVPFFVFLAQWLFP